MLSSSGCFDPRLDCTSATKSRPRSYRVMEGVNAHYSSTSSSSSSYYYYLNLVFVHRAQGERQAPREASRYVNSRTTAVAPCWVRKEPHAYEPNECGEC